MKKNALKSMFGAWMALFMTMLMSVFVSCEKLEQDMDTKSQTTATKKVYVQSKEREILSPTTERCSFEKVTKVGTDIDIQKKSIILKREVKGIPEYTKEVSGFEYKHKHDNQIVVGTAEYNRTEDNFKVNGRTDLMSALLVNGFDADDITTSYSFYHESCTYDDGEVQVEFEFLEPTFREKSTVVASAAYPATDKEAARLTNTILTSYFRYDQDVSETVLLLMDKEITITDEGFVTTSCKETIADGTAKAYFLYRINKSDGSHEDFDVEVSDTREATVKGPWSSIESNNTQSTGSATKTEKSSTDKSTTKDGFTVNWKRYAYDVKASVTLEGSTQTNLIETVEPEGWTASYRGKTYTIPRSTYNVSNDKGTVTGGSEKDGYNVYDYANKFTYTRASNTQNFTTKGVIKVKKEIVVTEEGFVTGSCKETISDGTAKAYFLYRISKSDGSHQDYDVEVSDTREATVKGPWSSIESNNNQSTGSASKTEKGSTDKSTTKDGFTIKWKRYAYDVKASVSLAGSTQTNLIETVEPEGWTASYRGKTYTIPRSTYSVSNDKGTVTGGSEKNGYNVYDYANKFTYTRASNTKNFTTKGEIKVKVEVKISDEGFVTGSCKETISDGTAKAYFLYRINKSDGSHEDFDVEVSDTRDATVKGPWSSIESNNNQSTGSASKTEKSSTDKSTTKDGFSIKWKRYAYDVKASVSLNGSTQTNLIETVEPEGWTASYRGKTYTIPRSTYSVSNDKGTVTGGSEKNGYNVYDYANKFTYTRGSNTKNFTTKGEIKVKVEVKVTDEGFVTGSCKETISDGTAKAYFLYRINKSDGSHEDFDVEVSDTREAAVKGPWSSIESNNNQSTGSASKTEKGSTDKSTTKNGFTINWKRYSYDVKASVSLAGSTQTNLIETVEPEGWTASYRGKTYTIPRSTYNVSNDKGTVTGGSEKNGYNVYDYANKFTYTRGSNTKNFTTKGEINVKKEEPTFFPPEWGTLEYARQTVANNESHTGYVYTLSLRFSAGYTLPVVIRAGSTIPEWHFEYVEKTDVTDYNGGTYEKTTNTWINTKAMDKPNQMVWSRYSKEKANQDYVVAANIGWDEGHTVDGHPSTQTSRYQITVSGGRLTVKDTYNGNNIGSWK